MIPQQIWIWSNKKKFRFVPSIIEKEAKKDVETNEIHKLALCIHCQLLH